MFSQATTHQLYPSNGIHLTADDIRAELELGEDVHVAPTKLICLENTMSGMVFPQDEVVKISQMAKEHDIPMHLDGARLWNAAAQAMEDRGMDAADEEDRRKM
jgi:threonine aldolase